MTSTPAQQTTANAPTAPNGTASYASAASTQKKQSAPLVAGGSTAPPIASGTSQHAKSSSVSPVNGRPIMPAVPTVAPAVAVGTNGENHARKPSVTMSGSNNYSANGAAGGPKIQFGFQASPAVSHSTPQGASAPIPIPGRDNSNPRVPSPQNSPSPIPQPSASGGRPPSSAQAGGQLTFGSFGGNGETQMRRPSGASQNPSHIRNESSQSMANDPSNQGAPAQGGPPGRGGYSQAGRGRGGYNPNYNNHNQMGYPPNGTPPFRPGHPSQGRGGMAPNFQPRASYGPGTPPMGRASPALPNAMPVPGQNPYYYQPPNMGGPMQNVTSPPTGSFEYTSHKPYKRKSQRGRDVEKSFIGRQRTQSNDLAREGGKPRRNTKRVDNRFLQDVVQTDPRWNGQLPAERGQHIHTSQPPDHPQMLPLPHPSLSHHYLDDLDMSPASGNFERLLTQQQQGYYPPPGAPFDPMRTMAGPHPYMYPMSGQPHSPAPNFQTPYNGPPQSFAPQPMSRNPSQASEPRPTSSASQAQGSQGTSQQVPPHLSKPVVASSPQFTKPKKSAAVTIRNANGDLVDLASLKAPASPAPSVQSKTPPVIASTPTPPPKSSTPKVPAPSHTRADSTATKTQAEVQNEFKEKIARQIAADEKAKEDETKAAETKAAEEAEAAEAKAKEEERLKAEGKAEEERKAAEEAKAKEEAEKKPEPAAPAVNEEDEMERMIREMEEEDARREAEQAEISRKKKAAADAKKAADEAAKKDANSDAKLKEAEAEAERLEEEKERKRREAEGKAAPSAAGEALSSKLSSMTISEKEPTSATSKLANLTINDKPVAGAKVSPGEKRGTKPAPLNLNTSVGVEPPQPSAALQSLKTARAFKIPSELMAVDYPEGINSPNPALNPSVSKKGTSFKYDPSFLLQFQGVFTEKPSLEFGQQVKTLIGDGDGGRSASVRTPAGSGRQNSRPGASGFQMGSFGAPPAGKTLPPGTTSDQRFAMSQGQISRPPMGSLNSFQRPGGAFPGGIGMARTPSSSNMAPNSPRTASSRRGASKRNNYDAKNEEKAAKTMPLTAGMKIEAIKVSETGWKPTSLVGKPSAPTPGGLMDPPMVQRKVKAALNKMTPENFDRIAQSILDIAAQSKDESDGRTLRQVIQLTFEKATDEAHWASMYAKFAKRMLETMSPEVRDENIKDRNGNVVSGGALFRKYLLNRCQEEFERGWKTQLPELGEGDSKEAALMSDEYYIAAAAKRRGLGLVQFIGELYKLSMLTERIMHECVRKLVDFQGMPDEAEVESLSKLLRTIGGNLDSTDKGKLMMDAYFQRIQTMIDYPDIPSRLKFMLMDVVDLRRTGWISKETNKGPKTLEEVRAEAEAAAAQKAAEAAAKSNQRGGGGRLPMGRGDARQFSSGYAQQAPNTVGMDDLRRLKGSANRTSSGNISLGPTSMFSSRSNSGRRLGPGGSLSRGAEDSGASSRTGTPPVREAQSSTNAFSLLANMEDNHPTSPPSTAASPALSKVTPETTAAGKE